MSIEQQSETSLPDNEMLIQSAALIERMVPMLLACERLIREIRDLCGERKKAIELRQALGFGNSNFVVRSMQALVDQSLVQQRERNEAIHKECDNQRRTMTTQRAAMKLQQDSLERVRKRPKIAGDQGAGSSLPGGLTSFPLVP